MRLLLKQGLALLMEPFSITEEKGITLFIESDEFEVGSSKINYRVNKSLEKSYNQNKGIPIKGKTLSAESVTIKVEVEGVDVYKSNPIPLSRMLVLGDTDAMKAPASIAQLNERMTLLEQSNARLRKEMHQLTQGIVELDKKGEIL